MTERAAWRERLGALGVWSHLDGLAASEMRAFVRRAEAMGFGAVWVPETVGREPYTLLGALSAETERIILGTSIASIWGHDAMSTRMASMTLHELTGGRFVLGLGVSHPHLAQKRGQWRLHHHPVDATLVPMYTAICAGGMARMIGAGQGERLGTCEATDCDRVFIDVSKNASRRFCSTTCQNRVKAAAFRHRRTAID